MQIKWSQDGNGPGSQQTGIHFGLPFTKINRKKFTTTFINDKYTWNEVTMGERQQKPEETHSKLLDIRISKA